MTYIDTVRYALNVELPGLDEDLLDLYSLLTLVKGERTTHEDVHDAWSLWRRRTMPNHRSLIPFDELRADVQELDGPYVDAIRKVAAHTGKQ